MDVGIREAARKDKEFFVDMREEFLGYHTDYHPDFIDLEDEREEIFTSEFEEVLKDPDRFLLIAEIEEEETGFLEASLAENPEVFEEERIGEIEKLFVRKSFRGEGIGDELVTRAEEWFREKGVGAVKARVIEGNESACEFWDSRGFEDLIKVKYKEI